MLFKISTSHNIKREEVAWVLSNIYNTKVKVSYDDLVSKQNHNVSLSEALFKKYLILTENSDFTDGGSFCKKVFTLIQQFSSEMGLNKTKF